MHVRRRVLLAIAVVTTVVALPARAFANGGAYIEFDKTHYVPGQQAKGTTYVSIPAKQRDLLDEGPFYAYLLTGGRLREHQPIPAGAIRVGTWTVTPEDGQHELEVAFTVPDVAGDYYDVGFCNDPCTLSGFGEPLTGQVSVVATAREGELLRDNGKLQAQLGGTRHDLRKAEKTVEELQGELQVSEAALADLNASADVGDAAAASADTDDTTRPLIDPWAAIVVALGLVVVAVVLQRRRTSRGGVISEAGNA